MLWLGVAYLGALAALFITALWTANGFTGNIERTWTLDNFRSMLFERQFPGFQHLSLKEGSLFPYETDKEEMYESAFTALDQKTI